MNLIKTSILTGIATAIKLASGLVVSKVIAVYIGPVGFVIVGQFQNFSVLAQIFAGSLIQSGVVKYVSEFKDSLEEKKKVLSTGLFICIISSIVIGCALFFFRSSISEIFLHDKKYGFIIGVFGFSIILFTLNTFLSCVLNGERDVKKYTVVNIATSIFALVLTSFLSYRYGVVGALLSIVLNQSTVFFITLGMVINSHWFKISYFFSGIDKSYMIKYFKYAVMTVISTLSIPVTQMIIRSYMVNELSWNEAGYWQAVIKISDIYLMFITTTLTVYYLPRLSEIQEHFELKKEILYGYKMILPAAIILALGIFLSKTLIVYILFTPKFMPMLPLFKYQLLGDVFKVGAWILSYLMLAKAMTKTFIITEIMSSILYVLLSIIFISYFGLIGVTLAFAVNYGLYWVCMLIIFYRKKSWREVKYGV